MLTVALTPVKAAAASAPCTVVDMAETLAAGSWTTTGAFDAGGGGTADSGGTCRNEGVIEPLLPTVPQDPSLRQYSGLAIHGLAQARTQHTSRKTGQPLVS